MIDVKIERIADEVRDAFDLHEPPIDPLAIAREEGIRLGPGDYGPEFCGRIEYHQKQRAFLLFYPDLARAANVGRVRFSVAHELGHYYLPDHRAMLLRGTGIACQAGFVSDKEHERVADRFAAALLLPRAGLDAYLNRRSFMTMAHIRQLAATWQTSLTCAAIRYVQYATEACAVVLSEDGKVKFYIPSDGAETDGFKWLGKRDVPAGSPTARALSKSIPGEVVEGHAVSGAWFSERRKSVDVWEEAVDIGYSRQVLTLLALESPDDDDE